MKEVKKCSLSGIAFTMDADAYEALESYLESLKKAYAGMAEGAEIIADIEARIAELILSVQDGARVVEKPLVQNIIAQMGSAEDISEHEVAGGTEEPRIPRRLYRDMENAKLGGVCAGIGRYFDIDPVWVRLGMFCPMILCGFGWIPFLRWAGPMMGNLFGVFVVCYLIMWFAVPAARTARQKLEMNGERITAQSIGETTAAATPASDPDTKARSIVADAVSALGQVVLILMKIFAGLIVFGLILTACALIIGLFAILLGGYEFIGCLSEMGLWVSVSGIFVALIPVIMLIYVLMCLIASRKPGGKTVLVIFLLWLASILLCSGLAVRQNIGQKLQKKHGAIQRVLGTQVEIDGEAKTLQEILEEYDIESYIENNDTEGTLHISVPSKSLEISVDKARGEMKIDSGGKKMSIRATTESAEASADNE